MTNQSWIDSEPGTRAGLRQAARLLRGGFRRFGVTFATTLFVATAVLVRFALKKHVYAPEVVLRVVEMDRDPLSAPRPDHDLQAYVREAVWTDAKLLEVIRRFGLYARAADPRAALESFQSDIDVDVSQNYFAQERSASDPPRSARVGVRFRSVDPAEATAVARALSTLVVDHELASRSEQAVRAESNVDQELAGARRAQLALRAQIAQKQSEILSTPTADPWLEVRLISLLGSLDMLERQTAESERRELALSMGAAVERQRIGLRFTVVDDGVLPVAPGLGYLGLAGVASVALLLGLPLAALTVGAVDWKRGAA